MARESVSTGDQRSPLVVLLWFVIVALVLVTTVSVFEPTAGERIRGYVQSKWRAYTGTVT